MAVEEMITRAILQDSFTPTLLKISREQDAYAKRTAQLGAAANGAGALAVGASVLGVQAVQKAAAMQQQQAAFKSLLGDAQKGKEMFDAVRKFGIDTPFEFPDVAKSAQTLLGFGMTAEQVIPALTALGNAESAAGRGGEDLQRAAVALGQMNGKTLQMEEVNQLIENGVPAFKILREELGLTTQQMSNLGNLHIDGKIGAEAIMRGIQKGNLKTGMSDQMNSLNGQVSTLKDNWNGFLAAAGQPALEPLTNLTKEANNLLGRFQELPASVQKGLGGAVLIGGPVLAVTAGILKGVEAWRTYRGILGLVKTAADAERAGEAAKVGVAGREAAAVKGSALAYDGLKGRLSSVGLAATAATKAEGFFGSSLTAGIVTIGLYGVALAGLVAVGYELVQTYKAIGDAQASVAQGDAAVKAAQDKGYAISDGKATGYAAMTKPQMLWQTIKEAFGAAPTMATESEATMTPEMMARAKHHAMPANGVRAQQIAAQQKAAADAAKKAADAAREKRAQDANNFKLGPQAEYQIAHDERQIALLEAKRAKQSEINAAKQVEINHLNEAAKLYADAAKNATDPAAKYKLLGDSEEMAQKAQMLALDKNKKAKDAGFDPLIAKILGGSGLDADSLISSGVSRRFFRSFGKEGGGKPENPYAKAIAAATKRPLVIPLSVDGKVLETFKMDVEDDVFKALGNLIKDTHGSGPIPAY